MWSEQIFVVLFGWAVLLSGYAPSLDEASVQVHYGVEHQWFIDNKCDGKEPCSAVAVYKMLPEAHIILSEQLDRDNRIYSYSVLVHEFTHYLQDVHRELDPAECRRLETEAYAVQQTFLRDHGSDRVVKFKPRLDCE